jgi:hypothetical protein
MPHFHQAFFSLASVDFIPQELLNVLSIVAASIIFHRITHSLMIDKYGLGYCVNFIAAQRTM